MPPSRLTNIAPPTHRRGNSTQTEAVTVLLPRRRFYVTRDAVAAVLASAPNASLRQVRAALGGGSLRDISEMVGAVRGKELGALHQALHRDQDLGGKLVDVIEQLVSQVAQLQRTVHSLSAASAAPASHTDVDVPRGEKTVLAALERYDARNAQQMAAISAVIADFKRLVTTESNTAAAGTTQRQRELVDQLPAALHSIEARISNLARTIDVDRLERAQSTNSLEAPEVEGLQRQVHRMTQTVDAQFGLVRRLAQSAQAPTAQLAGVHSDLNKIERQIANLTRRLSRPPEASASLDSSRVTRKRQLAQSATAVKIQTPHRRLGAARLPGARQRR